jgi:tetratricopeptide (TPR) repeat protein
VRAYYNNRGTAYNEKGDYDRAIVDLDQSIQLDPNYANPYSHRGYAYGRKGDYARGMADLNKALALNRKYPRGYSNRPPSTNCMATSTRPSPTPTKRSDSIPMMRWPTTGAAKPTSTRSSMTWQ